MRTDTKISSVFDSSRTPTVCSELSCAHLGGGDEAAKLGEPLFFSPFYEGFVLCLLAWNLWRQK